MTARALLRIDDERAEEPLPHTLGRVLMRVVPERPDLFRAETVDVAAARLDGVLRHPGDTVFRVRDVEAVPVDRHAVADVLVDERDLDEVALPDAKLRAGALPLNVHAFTSWPDASRTGAFSAVSVTL